MGVLAKLYIECFIRLWGFGVALYRVFLGYGDFGEALHRVFNRLWGFW